MNVLALEFKANNDVNSQVDKERSPKGSKSVPLAVVSVSAGTGSSEPFTNDSFLVFGREPSVSR